MTMPPPAVPQDPEGPDRIGAYRVLGRLSESCCSVATYLAEGPSEARVAVRHYADPAARRPADPASLEQVRQASPVGIAQVLDAGSDHVVSEYIDGTSLPEQIENHGALSGAVLQRLAIGTITALAALHRAGIEHVEIRPDRILLGPDGPRLVYFGAEEHDMSGPSHQTNPVSSDSLAWRTPEELRGYRPTAASDVFTWASVMAYAATGRDPFEAGSLTAVTQRLANAAANLGQTEEGPLRDLLADCLTSEPAERPSAEDALLRLIGHTGVLDTAVPDLIPGPVPDRAPRLAADARSPRRGILLPVAAALAIALVSGGASAAVTLASADRPSSPAPGQTSAWTPRAVPPAPDSPPKAETEVALPDGLGTLYEHPDDQVRLSTIRVNTGERDQAHASYARDPRSGAFTRIGQFNIAAEASPDGRWLATMDSLYLATSNRLDVTFTDHLTGARFSVPALRSPYTAVGLAWSRQSDAVVVTVIEQKEDEPAYAAGFVIIDVAARTSMFAPTTDADEIKSAGSAIDPGSFLAYYRWAPDGRSVATRYLTAEWGTGMIFRDLSGQPIRLLHWVGVPTGNGDWFSPSGAAFLTSGCGTSFAICTWRTESGDRMATLTGRKDSTVLGWYDEKHVIEAHPAPGDLRRVVVRDLAGKEVRVLAEVSAAASDSVDVRYTRG
jgi:hypothetical protein